MIRTFRSLALLSIVFSLSWPATADDTKTADQDTTTGVSVAGVQVAIDPQTGKLRAPTKSEAAAMAEQFRRRFLDLSVDKPAVYHADGSISKELGSRNRMYTVARVGAKGELETACLPGEQAARFIEQAGVEASPEAESE